MCAASTSFFWVFATSQPIKAQVNPQSAGELLPVPKSPSTKSQAPQSVPPPPGEQTSAVLPNSTGFANVNNLVLSNEATQSLGQLENSFIQESKNAGQSVSRRSKNPTPVAPLKTQQFSAIGGDSSDSIGLQQSSSLVSQSLGQLNSQSSNTNTQEFTAPGMAPGTGPTFNQLLNSQPSNGAVAPLPPVVGESQSSQFGTNLVTNTTPTFNQLLNSSTTSRGNQANLTGTAPTFNQLLNGQKVVNQSFVNSNAPLTFEQILNAQPGASGVPTQSAPLSYEQILNAPVGDPNQSMATSVAPTFNQILNSQGGTFPTQGEAIRQERLQSQTRPERTTRPSTEARPLLNSTALTEPTLRVEGVYVTQKETSARARVAGIYPLTPNVLFGATLDLVSNGSTFTDSRNEGLNINELYFATSLNGLPNLRFVVGQLDLTSYFDRNSFAKDGASQFFNPVFQTNPALAATGIASRPSLLVNWSVTDNIDAKAAVFSSSNSLSNFTLDGFAGEVGVRYGNAIIRGTYATDRDGGNRDSFPEIFSIARGNGQFGILRDDREEAYGLNAEVFIPNLKLGLFGRYGRYENRDANRSADTYVLGASLLDLFTPDDRLGIAYGQALTSDSLRRGDRPDVLEMYYDFPFLSNLRLGFTVQGRDSFEETVLGVRVKSDFDITPRGRGR
ncbi:MAG: carbohydrate porin [Calothrix sp. FI2-JRJ7]|nr:carbohydrate porin [Calothrix sp. FI2-JRJ7]